MDPKACLPDRRGLVLVPFRCVGFPRFFTPAWVGVARVAVSERLGALVLTAWRSLQIHAMRGRGLPGMWAVPAGACLPLQ